MNDNRPYTAERCLQGHWHVMRGLTTITPPLPKQEALELARYLQRDDNQIPSRHRVRPVPKPDKI